MNGFLKSGMQFRHGIAVKANNIVYTNNMTYKATIDLTIVDLSSISSMNHGVYGVTPTCSRKRRASRTWYGFASF